MGTSARERPGPGAVLGTFFYMWLLIGLVLGTGVLVGPVRWITEVIHNRGWQQSRENHILIVVIFAFIILSLVLTRYVVGFMFRARSRNVRLTVVAVTTVIAALTAWEWSNPAKLLAAAAGGEAPSDYDIAGGAEFEFGAYPDYNKLAELKKEGVTSIVSLQHPGVVIELEGIRSERDATSKLKLNFIQAPMLPWVSDNDEAVAKLRELARVGRGKYYVHCGLGRDRVNIAKRIIEGEGKRVSATNTLLHATAFADRPTPFERGSLAHLDHEKWIIPYPNKFELFGYVLNGAAGDIVSILDPSTPQEAKWNAELRQLLPKYAVNLVFLPLRDGDAKQAAAVAKAVRAMPGTVTVIAPFTPMEDGKPTPGSGPAQQLIAAYGRLAPASYAAKPTWHLNHAAHGGLDTLAGTVGH